MNKRDFLRNALLAGASTFAGFKAIGRPRLVDQYGETDEALPLDGSQTGGPFSLPALPYDKAALEPHIDAETMELHHDRHHMTYVAKLNSAVINSEAAKMGLDELMRNVAKFGPAVRNNGGGHWNHSFFWPLLSPTPTQPDGALLKVIDRDFGSLDKMKEEFAKAATDRFGSGWAWLIVTKGKKLKITSTPNQDNPLMNLPGIEQGTPILALDVWEHAYYLKYRNKRADYITAFWNIVNWQRVSELYNKA